MSTSLTIVEEISDLSSCDTLLVIGRAATLAGVDLALVLGAPLAPAVREALIGATAGDRGRSSGTWLTSPTRRLVFGVLPERVSRHNTPSAALVIPAFVRGSGAAKRLAVLCLIDDKAYALAVATAVARGLPLFAARSTPERTVSLCVVAPSGPVASADLTPTTTAVRLAAAWVDTPPDRLGPDALVRAATEIAARLPGVHQHVLRGDQLRDQGLGGLHGVGRAAEQPPALVVLDYTHPSPTQKIAWVGKGIVYDTGGLSLKTKTGMPGMKTDMGGAAAVLAAFEAAVRGAPAVQLTAVLCIAENAIGPRAVRPDDILELYSGRTVEVNNTDAEGRLVLADGCAWVARNRSPELLIDVATLTGAQAMATGTDIAAIVASDEETERRAVHAGRRSGDLVHPLPFAPELHRRELHSHVADMRNSVKNRGNAQASCAAQFIANHLGDYDGHWLHVDMAGPSTSAGHGTGFGVGLLLALLDAPRDPLAANETV